MKSITLIRHAKAENSSFGSDADRSLTREGKYDSILMGRVISAILNPPDLFLCSPAKRAVKTSKCILKETDTPKTLLRIEPRLYSAPMEYLVSLISTWDNSLNHILICGHNPGLSEFLAYLSDSPVEPLPPCGIANLVFSADTWQSVIEHSGTLQVYDFPERHYGLEGKARIEA